MKVDILGAIITVAGLIFFAVSLAIIILGKKVGSQTGPQKVKVGKYIEVNTNAVLMLVLITACFSIAPLALNFWKPDLAAYVHRDELSRNYLAIDDLSVVIHGAVILDDGRFADSVNIEVIRCLGNQEDTLHDRTGSQGDFYIELAHPLPREKYTITWDRNGYNSRTLRFGFTEIPFPLVLEKEGGE